MDICCFSLGLLGTRLFKTIQTQIEKQIDRTMGLKVLYVRFLFLLNVVSCPDGKMVVVLMVMMVAR